MNEVGERRLAESYVMRRLAQLTIYQWTKLSEWATRQGNNLNRFSLAIDYIFPYGLAESVVWLHP